MNVNMEEENQNANGSSSPTPDVLPLENHDDSLNHDTPPPGTVIPNRIFVGRIHYNVNESDLRHVFSQHGAVKEVKIVMDRSGMSKGYGFVTFETQDDALKILHDTNGIYVKNKKLNIGQAVYKQKASGQTQSVTMPDFAMPVPCGTLYLTTSAGYPCTYHNRVAYFHCPNMSPPAPHWPPAPPMMLPPFHQPVYEQPAYHHQQCAPNQYQWNVVQPPMPSSPVVYSQQSEYVYPPPDGGPVQPLLPVLENITTENQISTLARPPEATALPLHLPQGLPLPARSSRALRRLHPSLSPTFYVG